MRDAAKRGDLPIRIHEMLCREPTLQGVRVLAIARRLGVSVRTLSRALEAQGTSFRMLIEGVRIQLAIRELSHGVASIAELSEQLGFASPKGFHRAFKRWTGTTPTSLRKRGRSALPKKVSGRDIARYIGD